MMRKKIARIALLTLTALSLTGCGVVKVVKIGEEGNYTGKTTFNSDAESSDDWSKVADEITEKAQDFSKVLSGDGFSGTDPIAVTGTATIEEFNTDTPKYYLLLKVDGYDEGEIKMQAGGVYSGTAVRDVQTIKAFEDFTNQTEWSQYAKALNVQVDTQVIAPLALDASVAGKKITFTGSAAKSNGTITVTPVSVTIE